MCLYVIIHKKSLFLNTFFAVTFLFLIWLKNEAFLKSQEPVGLTLE